MIRTVLLALTLLLSMAAAGVVQAQGTVILAPNEFLAGQFVQERHLTGASAPLRAEGRFLLAPGKGLIWRSEKPFKTTTVITAAGIIQKIEQSESLRLPAERLPFLRKFYDMLSGALAGNLAALQQDFIVMRDGDGRAWRMILQPMRPDDSMAAQISSITLSGGQFVETVEIRKTGGDWDRLVFSDQKTSTAALGPEDAADFGMVPR
jgi:hypothetical protein